MHKRKIYGEDSSALDANAVKDVENHVYGQMQTECFKEEHDLLKNGKSVSSNSQLPNMDRQFDKNAEVIRVGAG